MIPMSVVAVVLFAALCHATWNAVVKSGSDTLMSSVLVAAGCGIIAGVALPFLEQPAIASWPFIAGSVAAQVVYMALLAATYRVGDMSQTYPIMRGTAPLLVALASGPLVGETLSTHQWLGVAIISGGIAAMALAAPRQRGSLAAPGFALSNAAVIASYTIIDGLGVRRSGATVAYAFWTFLLTAVPLVAWAVLRRRGTFRSYAVAHWPVAVIGGAGTLTSYSLALWAMTVAPVAVIASLREISILFATGISAFVLKERVPPLRLASVAVIMAGAIVLRGI